MKAGIRYWAMIALFLGATAGTAYLSHGEATPPAKALSEFPSQVDGFQAAVDWPLDQKTIDLLGVTDYLNRGYVSLTQGPVGLYIGYFRSQRTGASIHSPKNCLPGAGWTPLQASVYELPLADGRKVPVNLYIVRKDLDEELVMYWYQAHGRIVASEYWGKFYLIFDAMRLNRTDAALVRITAPIQRGDEAQARARAIAFAQQITGDVDQIIPK
jgi:EpsI family protein